MSTVKEGQYFRNHSTSSNTLLSSQPRSTKVLNKGMTKGMKADRNECRTEGSKVWSDYQHINTPRKTDKSNVSLFTMSQ